MDKLLSSAKRSSSNNFAIDMNKEITFLGKRVKMYEISVKLLTVKRGNIVAILDADEISVIKCFWDEFIDVKTDIIKSYEDLILKYVREDTMSLKIVFETKLDWFELTVWHSSVESCVMKDPEVIKALVASGTNAESYYFHLKSIGLKDSDILESLYKNIAWYGHSYFSHGLDSNLYKLCNLLEIIRFDPMQLVMDLVKNANMIFIEEFAEECYSKLKVYRNDYYTYKSNQFNFAYDLTPDYITITVCYSNGKFISSSRLPRIGSFISTFKEFVNLIKSMDCYDSELLKPVRDVYETISKVESKEYIDLVSPIKYPDEFCKCIYNLDDITACVQRDYSFYYEDWVRVLRRIKLDVDYLELE